MSEIITSEAAGENNKRSEEMKDDNKEVDDKVDESLKFRKKWKK